LDSDEHRNRRKQSKFLRICKPAVIGDHIDGWRVFFFVMVERTRLARSLQ
jgi:hypothetical protein